VLTAIVTRGQFPENPDVFDLTNAASSTVLALGLITAGLDQLFAFRTRARLALGELEQRLALAQIDVESLTRQRDGMELDLSTARINRDIYTDLNETLKARIVSVEGQRDEWQAIAERGIALARRSRGLPPAWSDDSEDEADDYDDEAAPDAMAQFADMAPPENGQTNVVQIFPKHSSPEA